MTGLENFKSDKVRKLNMTGLENFKYDRVRKL